MKNLFLAICCVGLLATPLKRAESAEVVLITTAGILGTVVIYGLGFAGYGTGYLSLASINKAPYKVEVQKRVLDEATDVYSTGQVENLGVEVSNIMSDLRVVFPEASDLTDLELLEDIVISYQKTGL